MAQIPVAPLAADIQAVLQELLVQPDAHPEAPAVQPAALQADGPQPPPGGELAAVQPAVEVIAQGAAEPAGPLELVGSIYSDFLFRAGSCFVKFYPFTFLFVVYTNLFFSSHLRFTRGMGPFATRITSLKFCSSFFIWSDMGYLAQILF